MTLTNLTDRQLLEAIYNDLGAKIEGVRLEVAALRTTVAILARAQGVVASRVDALISDSRAKAAPVRAPMPPRPPVRLPKAAAQ